jgi:hypothetical protein
VTKREQKAARKQKILENKMIEAAEKLGWSVTIDRNDGAWEFSQSSPAGEDFSFTAGGTDLESVIEDVKDYACHFDIDEHIEMWIGARRNGVAGVPSTRELVADAEAIDKMLQELAIALQELEEV